MNKKQLLLLFLPIILFGGYLTYRSVHWKLAARENKKEEASLEAKWRSNNFLSLTNNRAALSNTVSLRLSKQLDKAIDQTQRNALSKTITQMLLAYSSGSVEDWMKFRFPIYDRDSGILLNLQSIGWKRDRLVDNGFPLVTNSDLIVDCLEVSKQFFRLAEGWTNSAGKKMYLTKGWLGFSPESLTVIPQELHSSMFSLQDFLLKDGNLNLQHVVPLVVYDKDAILKHDKKVEYAAVHFVVKSEGQNEAFPVYIAFFWHPRYQQWLPDEMILPVLNGPIENLLY
jgi:hypothetical protein